MDSQLRVLLIWSFVFAGVLISLALMFCVGLTAHFPGAENCNRILDLVRQVRQALGLL